MGGGSVGEDEKVMLICFGSYHIQNVRNGGLEFALCGMTHTNMDLGVFQYTTIIGRIYVQGSSGYSAITTDRTSWYQVSVALF